MRAPEPAATWTSVPSSSTVTPVSEVPGGWLRRTPVTPPKPRPVSVSAADVCTVNVPAASAASACTVTATAWVAVSPLESVGSAARYRSRRLPG
ncbi:MAG: hypothetical protein HY814_08790 [Candidatus Riflebacteria bacterium]|nr:hypothetical protein [Candidatus Riflebacteria bacterium]